MTTITFDEFKKVEIRAGKIISAEKIPDTDKLLKLMVDFGEFEEVKGTIESGSIGQAKGAEVVATSVAEPVSASVIQPATPSATEPMMTVRETKDGTKTETVPTAPKIPKIRQIVSGIALKFPDTASLVGKTCMFVTNLEPRMIKGYESNGMLFAVSTPEGGFSLLEPNVTIPPGTLAV